jgi:hypothetical protein
VTGPNSCLAAVFFETLDIATPFVG